MPSEELETFRHRVRSDIVSQVLVHREALRIGLQPDGARIDAGIDAYELRNVGNLDWQARREKILPRLVERLERQDLLEQMEQRVRSLPPPSAKSIRRFYLDNPEKFTEPRQLRLSVLLLTVSPESDEQTWQRAELDAADFAARIEAGETTADLPAGVVTRGSPSGVARRDRQWSSVRPARVRTSIRI